MCKMHGKKDIIIRDWKSAGNVAKKRKRSHSKDIYTVELASLMDRLNEVENLSIDSMIIEH